MEFDDFLIDSAALELRRRGERVELNPQAVQLLQYLLERRGQLVSRNELYSVLWPAGAVLDRERALNTLVRQIRLALGDATVEPRYIRTYPRRGYRFLPATPVEAPVSVMPVSASQGVPAGKSARARAALRKFGGPALGAATVFLVVLAWLGDRPRSVSDDEGVPAAAREAYRLGRHLLESPDLSQRETAVMYLAEAVRLAPGSATARAHLADAHLWAGDAARAATEAARALSLDRDEPHALLVSGVLTLVQSWDWPRAESLVRKAVRRRPDNAAYAVVLAFVLSTAGRAAEAVPLLDRARTMDPVTAIVRTDIGLMYLYAGQIRKAAEACEEAFRLAPAAGYAYACATYARGALGDLEVARAHARSVIRLAGSSDAEVMGADSLPAAAALDRFREWQALRIARDTLANGFGAALAFAQAGWSVRALTALEKASTRRDLGFVTITVDPRFAALRGDPVFRRLAAPLVAKGAAPLS